jgi:hypothetical protein
VREQEQDAKKWGPVFRIDPALIFFDESRVPARLRSKAAKVLLDGTGIASRGPRRQLSTRRHCRVIHALNSPTSVAAHRGHAPRDRHVVFV